MAVAFVLAPWCVQGQLVVRESPDVEQEAGWRHFSQRPKDQEGVPHDLVNATDQELWTMGYYRLYAHIGRRLPVKDLLKVDEKWEKANIKPSEKIEYLPRWEATYRWRSTDRLLLVGDDDKTVYVASAAGGFDPVGQIRTKGILRRGFAALDRLVHRVDGWSHLALSAFGL